LPVTANVAPPAAPALAKKGAEPGITSPTVAAHHSGSAMFLNCSRPSSPYLA